MAAATMRQISRLIRQQGLALGNSPAEGVKFAEAAKVTDGIASTIEFGDIGEHDWEFLTWIAEPKVDLDASNEPPAPSA